MSNFIEFMADILKQSIFAIVTCSKNGQYNAKNNLTTLKLKPYIIILKTKVVNNLTLCELKLYKMK